MWCCLERAPRRACLSSAKLPTSAPCPTDAPGRRWANGPIVAPSSTSDDSSTLAQTRQPAPIRLSITWLPAPMTLPSPTAVAPRRMTLGSSTTSRASCDRGVDVDGGGVVHRHAGEHVRLVDPPAQVGLDRGQLDAVVDPRQLQVVVDRHRHDRPTVRPGERHQAGQVQLAGRGRGPRSPIQGRPQPGRVEGVGAADDLAECPLIRRRVLLLDDARAGPSSSRTTRP